MGDPVTAPERLQQAIVRLEAAALRIARQRAEQAAQDTEVAWLRAERERLDQALKDAEAENAAMRAANTQVGERLDRAIGQLRMLLGG